MSRIGMICAASLLALFSYSIGASSEQRRVVTMSDFLRSLASSTDAARVDYMGSCDAASPNHVIPPDVMVVNANPSQHGLSMLRTMLGNTKNAAVGESSGVIHVRIGAVDATIFHTRIKSLRLMPNQRYDPSEAIWALENSQEVQLELRKRNMRFALMQGGLESIPAEGEPHLSSAVQDLTVDEVLDKIARTFSGTVVVGECRQPNGQILISIRFMGH